MNIGLIGYGKMGKAIEKLALLRGHSIVFTILSSNRHELKPGLLKKADMAFEFSNPASSYENCMLCLDCGLPVVCGTTGWNEKLAMVRKQFLSKNGAFFYAANFSISVNIFFEINKSLARFMCGREEYNVSIHEIHHIHKKDAPSGTAIALADQIIQNNKVKKRWVQSKEPAKDHVSVTSERTGDVSGIHTITYSSLQDEIILTHHAKSRDAFAAGAVLAAEWLWKSIPMGKDKRGVFGMEDMLNFARL